MVQRVIRAAYVTSDNREFTDKLAAEEHQKRLNAYTAIKIIADQRCYASLVADVSTSPKLVTELIDALKRVQRFQVDQQRKVDNKTATMVKWHNAEVA